jgi:hypothetical protein
MSDSRPIGVTGDTVPRSGDWYCLARGCSTTISRDEGETLPTCGGEDVRWVWVEIVDEETSGEGEGDDV